MVIWKVIKDFPNYEVSSEGEIRSIRYKTPRPIKLFNHKEYQRVNLYKDGKSHAKRVHVLVAETFLDKPKVKDDEKLDVHHKDGNTSNNNVKNLVWLGRNEHAKIKKVDYIHMGKKVEQWDKTCSTLIKTWDRIVDAYDHLKEQGYKICASRMSQSCKNTNKNLTSGGFVWRYSTIENLPDEEWKICTIENYNIRVSNMGRIQRENWDIYYGYSDKDGYKYVKIKGRGYPVHRLIAMTFLNLDIKDKNQIINHIDENKSNNKLDNLQICTHKQNVLHSIPSRTGKNKRCPVHQVDDKGNIINSYESMVIAAKKYNVTASAIGHACENITRVKGYYWKK